MLTRYVKPVATANLDNRGTVALFVVLAIIGFVAWLAFAAAVEHHRSQADILRRIERIEKRLLN